MAETNHTLQFSDADYQKAAKDWKTPLLQMPLLALNDVLQYMTGMGNVRYKVALPTVEGSGQFAPYDAFRKTVNQTKVDFRELETYLGSFQEDFEPNQYVQMLIGQAAAYLGEGQKQAPSAKLVIACVMKALGYNLRQHLFDAKRNAAGKTTADLFDGWMTIIDKDITAGNISESKGNLLDLSSYTVNSSNAVDIAKHIERSCHPYLRNTQKFLYCAPEFADLYNDSYLLSHAGVSYNTQYEQPYVEGSGKKTTIVPLDILSGTSKYILTPKSNMLFGFANSGDETRLEVNRFSSFVLTLAGAMFFGTQIYTVDQRFFKVIDFGTAIEAAPAVTPTPSPGGSEGEGEEH